MLGEKASGIFNPTGTVDTDKGTSVDVWELGVRKVVRLTWRG